MKANVDHRPLPLLVQRDENANVRAEAQRLGLMPVVSQVLARRLDDTVNLARFLEAPLECLDDPTDLAEIDLATDRLRRALDSDEVIAINSDYDVDGIGGHSAALSGLRRLGANPDKVLSFIGNRLVDGFGLSRPVAERILAHEPRPSLVVTIDQGSSDEERIHLLKVHGIDTIVTDHHQLPVSGPPPSAYAVINPQRSDCRFPDTRIAGGMVIWLVLSHLRRSLLQRGAISPGPSALLVELDKVACSTVADCVSLASINNRVVVKEGLRLMANNDRPCWAVVKRMLKRDVFAASDIAFSIGPSINSKSRISTPEAGLHFLMANTIPDAEHWHNSMTHDNEERKRVERRMVDDALDHAHRLVADGRRCLTIGLEAGHGGVSGICASRIVERFGRPVFMFAPDATAGNWVGSGRSIDGLHLKDAMDAMRAIDPSIWIAGGGHSAAGGCTIVPDGLERFAELFDAVGRERLPANAVGPRLLSDGEVPSVYLTLGTYEALEILEPTGRGFEPPQFHGRFDVMQLRQVGDGTHLKLLLSDGRRAFEAIWFRALDTASDPTPVVVGENALFVYRLLENRFRGRRLELQVVGRADDEGP